jgi:hypothetical protein
MRHVPAHYGSMHMDLSKGAEGVGKHGSMQTASDDRLGMTYARSCAASAQRSLEQGRCAGVETDTATLPRSYAIGVRSPPSSVSTTVTSCIITSQPKSLRLAPSLRSTFASGPWLGGKGRVTSEKRSWLLFGKAELAA